MNEHNQVAQRNKPQPIIPISAATAGKLQSATSAALDAFNSAAGEHSVMAALNVAQGLADLRELFDSPEIKPRILALQDKAIGFRTDKDPAVNNRKTGQPNVPYGWEVVRDCCIEATLKGLQLVGNQMNIISSRMYATKEGYEGLIRKQKQITDFAPTIHVPRAAGNGNGVLIECEATWNHDGKPQSIKATIPVKTDDYSTIEQSLGKATRKFYKRCYERMTGNSIGDGDATEVDGDVIRDTEAKPIATEFKPRKKRETTEPTPTAPQATPPEVIIPMPEAQERTEQHQEAAATEPTPSTGAIALTKDQEQFAEFCADANVAFDKLVEWLKASNRLSKAYDPEGFHDIPDYVIAELRKSRPDIAKMVKECGKLEK